MRYVTIVCEKCEANARAPLTANSANMIPAGWTAVHVVKTSLDDKAQSPVRSVVIDLCPEHADAIPTPKPT